MTVSEKIQEMLNSLPFVTWDRFTHNGEASYCFYGWIERESDSYKDFVVIEVSFSERYTDMKTITSSQKYSLEIAKLLDMEESHTDCERVEDHFHITNVVKL